jgi:hypothetical protein
MFFLPQSRRVSHFSLVLPVLLLSTVQYVCLSFYLSGVKPAELTVDRAVWPQSIIPGSLQIDYQHDMRASHTTRVFFLSLLSILFCFRTPAFWEIWGYQGGELHIIRLYLTERDDSFLRKGGNYLYNLWYISSNYMISHFRFFRPVTWYHISASFVQLRDITFPLLSSSYVISLVRFFPPVTWYHMFASFVQLRDITCSLLSSSYVISHVRFFRAVMWHNLFASFVQLHV